MSHFFAIEENGYRVSTDPSLLDIPLIHAFLANDSYWAKGIPMEFVEKAIAHSLCFGLYHGGEQIGFARLVTDRSTFAYLADVFILPEWRGKELSKFMMRVIQSHPELQQLRRWVLATRDAHGLYEQMGWKIFDETTRSRFMHRHFPDVYEQLPENSQPTNS